MSEELPPTAADMLLVDLGVIRDARDAPDLLDRERIIRGTPEHLMVARAVLEELSKRSDDGKLRDSIALVRSALWDWSDDLERVTSPGEG